jgi:uncharacterized phage protein gp47/JayE
MEESVTDPDTSRHVEIKDGDQTVAAAEVVTSQQVGGTAQASLHAASGHIAPGSRASLVDAVMDLPEVQQSARLKAAVPLGDTESLERLRERTDDTATRAAGSTALVEAKIPADDEPGSGRTLMTNRLNRDPRCPYGAGVMMSSRTPARVSGLSP